MALMKKSDMVYDNYSWTAYGDDDPKVSGEPDSTLLNRKEGHRQPLPTLYILLYSGL